MGSPFRLTHPLMKRDTTISNAARNDAFKVKSSSMLQDSWGEWGGRGRWDDVGP